MTKTDRNLTEILRGGYCRRWHANPDLAHIRETLAEHHARVAQILLALHPAPSLQLIDAALHHDAGEPGIGDVTSPAKRKNPALAFVLDAAEADAREALGCNVKLSGDDMLWLKMADRLAALLHVSHVNPSLLSRDDWVDDLIDTIRQAFTLGCGPQVAAMLDHAVPF